MKKFHNLENLFGGICTNAQVWSQLGNQIDASEGNIDYFTISDAKGYSYEIPENTCMVLGAMGGHEGGSMFLILPTEYGTTMLIEPRHYRTSNDYTASFIGNTLSFGE